MFETKKCLARFCSWLPRLSLSLSLVGFLFSARGESRVIPGSGTIPEGNIPFHHSWGCAFLIMYTTFSRYLPRALKRLLNRIRPRKPRSEARNLQTRRCLLSYSPFLLSAERNTTKNYDAYIINTGALTHRASVEDTRSEKSRSDRARDGHG